MEQCLATTWKDVPDVQLAHPAQLIQPTEFDYANALQAQLPPIRTNGSDWFMYEDGAWQRISRDRLRPQAQAILPIPIRTARREATLLDHLEGRCQVPADSFRGFYRFDDSGSVLLNLANGVLRVTRGQTEPELLPPSADYAFTRKTAAAYPPGADAPLFQRVLAEALPDPEDRELFALCCGNILVPDCRFEAALVCYGEAGCGKSTLAEAVGNALGTGLVSRLSLTQICDSRSYHLPNVKFAALNLGTELDAVPIEDSANFKTLVSGEAVEARAIYGEPFTMNSGCKLWFLANGLPRFKNGSEAELRRMRFLRFEQTPKERDVTLKSRLQAEKDGILAFMIAGLQRLLVRSEIPLGGANSRAVHERFQVSNDPVGAFVKQACVLDPEAREVKDRIKSAFQEFCESNGIPGDCAVWFHRRLYERYPALREVRITQGPSRVRGIAGIALKNRLEMGLAE